MGEHSTCANCWRVLFVIMNLVFVVLGSGLIGFGSYLINLGNEHDYDDITGSEFISGAAVLVAAGGITFILAVVGIIGAILMWRPLLTIYVLVVMVIICLEIAAGIIGFVYRDTITDEVEDRMNGVFHDYTIGPDDPDYMEDVNDLVAYVQDRFECCGVNSSMDWLNSNPRVFFANSNQPPRECLCDLEEDDHCEMVDVNITSNEDPNLADGVFTEATYNAWDRGCLEVVEDNLNNIAIGVGVVGVVIGAIEIIGILVAIGLVVCITKDKSDTFV